MSRHKTLRAAGSAILALALAGTAGHDAAAQVFAGVGSGVSMPETVVAAPKPPAPPAEIIRHMPSTLDGLQLTGESRDVVWPVYLSRSQVSGARRFRIGYVSAISVLPDVSKLAVRINDRDIGVETIDAPRGLRNVEFTIPPGLMQEGYNAVELSVHQRHRVDCSIAATYELWTRIDPAQSGIVLAGESRGIASVSELRALLPRADGSLPIHVVLAGKTNPAHLQRLLAATSAIAVAANALQPVVDFDASATDVYGIDIAVGTRAALAKNPLFATVIGRADPLVRIVPASPFGRPTLVVTGTTEDEVDQAIASITQDLPSDGSAAGRAAALSYPGHATNGAEALALRDLGVRSEEFSGRFFRKSFNLALPADFLASDYGRGTFDLAGGYAAGLAHGAQVRVDVNGKSSGVIKLPYAGGDVFRHNQLFLPLSLMRPGLNRIDVYADLPRTDDASCEAPDTKRFLFADSSKIEFPTFARVQRLPDLVGTTAGGLPFAQGGARLVVPKPDRATMGSALSIVARVSVAAGKVIPFAFSTKVLGKGDGSTLIVAPARALDPAVMSEIDLDPREVEAAWSDVATAPLPATRMQGRWWMGGSDGPAACRLPSLARGSVPAPDAAAAAAISTTADAAPAALGRVALPKTDDDLLETWSEERHQRRNWLASLKELADRTQDWVASVPHVIRSSFVRAPRTDGVTPEASLILAQGMSRGSQGAVTTIVTAPNAQILQASVACLFDPQIWSQVHGRLAALDATRGIVTSTDSAKLRYFVGPHVSLSNARLVIAGWFSLEPMAFVAVAMLLALLLSGTTLWFVRGVGRRPE